MAASVPALVVFTYFSTRCMIQHQAPSVLKITDLPPSLEFARDEIQKTLGIRVRNDSGSSIELLGVECSCKCIKALDIPCVVKPEVSVRSIGQTSALY